MKAFPTEFADLLTPYGLRILDGRVEHARGLFNGGRNYFASFEKVIDRKKADLCLESLDRRLYEYLAYERRSIPSDSITAMTENYGESLSKVMRMKTAFFRRKSARAYKAAESIGLVTMMHSESFVRFAEAVSGYRLYRRWDMQVTCYEHGDYVGPHNDHHPEQEWLRRGFIDVHIMFANDAVAHQFLVYEQNGHLSKLVDVNRQGAVTIYRLPFWHYTTPLVGKPSREKEARRWLLLGSFVIEEE